MLLISCDSKYLFSVNGAYINVFSVQSGEIVYRLCYTQNDLKSDLLIKSICINPSNKYQLLSFHQHGYICLWDYEDGLLLKTYQSKLKFNHIVNKSNSIYALANLINQVEDQQEQSSLYKLLINEKSSLSLNSNNAINSNLNVEHQLILSNLKMAKKSNLVISYDEKYCAFIEGRKKLTICEFKLNSAQRRFNAKMELTCIAIHPSEDCIATGTTSGKIILWYNYLACMFENERSKSANTRTKPTMNILHWHSLPVLSLTFSLEGSYLLSGGHECVLVKWMFKSGQKDFKPRLGAPISSLACSNDNTLYVTRHLDNTIHLIGTNLNVIQTFSGFLCPKFCSQQFNDTLYPVGLKYFEPLNCFITNGKPGHLQFYAFNSDKLLFNLDIVDENYISPENLNRPNVHTEIELIDFNHDCTWLATVERRDDSVTTPEIRLKLWMFDKVNNKFSLNTLVRYPHSFEKVNKLKFKPNENILFTCGNDACFKSWILCENKKTAKSQMNENSFNWIYNTCNGYRDQSPSNIEFLNDQLFAVSFNHTITIWTFDQLNGVSFVDDLPHCNPLDTIKELKLFKNNFLLAMHEKTLNVWDVTNLTTEKSLLENSLLKNQVNCIWSHQTDEIVQVYDKLADKLILLVQNKPVHDDQDLPTEVKIVEFNIEKSTPKTTILHKSKIASLGKLHFICLAKSNEQQTSNDRKSSVLNSFDIFYTDDRGILDQLKLNDETLNSDMSSLELNESMWQNRQVLGKNLPQSNLSTILIAHKSNKLMNSQANRLIDASELNASFEENFKKIESTPAYLLPKVSSFCFDTLKSMLHKIDNRNITLTK